MAFHDSAPSRVWKFGCHPPRDQAIRQQMEQQFSFAHRYYNNLIELERHRRAQIENAVQKHSPALVALQQSVETILAQLQEARRNISERNQESRKRSGTASERDAIKAMEKRFREAKQAAKEEREKLWGQPIKAEKGVKKPRRHADDPIRIQRGGGNRSFLNEIERIENVSLHRQRQLRGGCSVFWGTYLLVEKAWKQACEDAMPALPHFRRWSGDGIIGVQLQGGLSAADAFGCTDSRLRLRMQEGHRSSRGQNGQAWLRIGSNGREPIWATFDFRLDRPLPDNAVIKWAVISRRRYGYHQTYPYEPIYRYHLNLTFSTVDGFEKQDRAAAGKVAVNAGWRVLGDGSLRVATWVGDDGEKGFVAIPEADVSRWTKADEIRGIRDKLFDEVRARLASWLEEQSAIVPDWLRDACTHIGQWRSGARLAALIGVGIQANRDGENRPRWRDNRFRGDEEMFALLEGWLGQTNHLWRWESNQRRKAVAWRDKLYEKLAVDLRRNYRELRVGKIDQRKLAARAKAEDEAEAAQAVRFHRTVAAPGRIGETLKDSFGKSNVVEVPAELLTQRCPYCGNEERWDAALEIEHRCGKCGRVFDQDIGHCMNLLAYEPPASGEDVGESPGAVRGPEDDGDARDTTERKESESVENNDAGQALAG